MQKRNYKAVREYPQTSNQKLFLNSCEKFTSNTTSNKSSAYKQYAPRTSAKQGFSMLGLLMVLSLMGSASLYLVNINSNIARGDEVYEGEQAVRELKLEREELRILQAQARSRVQEDEVVERHNMEPISYSQFVDLTDDSRIAADF